MSGFDFAVTGRTVWDEWVCDPELLRPNGLDQFGGSGANIATTIAHASGSCTFASVFGSDARSVSYVEYLSGILDLSLSARKQGALPRCAITPNKAFEWMDRELDPLNGAELDIALALGSAKAMVLVEPHMHHDFSGCGVPLYWSPQLALTLCEAQTVRLLDNPWSAVFLNAMEATHLERISGRTLPSLSRDNPRCCWVVTNGPDPTEVYSNGDRAVYETMKSDSQFAVGCGDAFAAGFCIGHCSDWGPDKAVELGHRLAHEVLAHVGCQLDRDRVLSALRAVRAGSVDV